MSWFRGAFGGELRLPRQVWPAAALVIFALVATGCGFRPLYGSSAAAHGAPDLAAISVEPIADRIGQQLRNKLVALLEADHPPTRPRYSLSVQLSESTQKLAVQRNELATRANYELSAVFGLSEGTKSLYTSRRTAISSYNILVSDFGTLTASTDAKNRAIEEIADAIRTGLAIYFNERRAQAGTVVP
jgi:LPS-assembly lipoprotein